MSDQITVPLGLYRQLSDAVWRADRQYDDESRAMLRDAAVALTEHDTRVNPQSWLWCEQGTGWESWGYCLRLGDGSVLRSPSYRTVQEADSHLRQEITRRRQ